MRRKNINRITKNDLVEHEMLIASYKDYLKKKFSYDEFEATIAYSDLDDPYDTPYIMQEHEGEINIDGIVYEVRFCYTDFGACGLSHMAKAAPFKFYMLFDKTTMNDNTVEGYQRARKVYIV